MYAQQCICTGWNKQKVQRFVGRHILIINLWYNLLNQVSNTVDCFSVSIICGSSCWLAHVIALVTVVTPVAYLECLKGGRVEFFK